MKEEGKCTARHEKFYGKEKDTGGIREAGHLQVTAPLTDMAGTQDVSAVSLAVAMLRPVRNGARKLGLDLIVMKNDIRGDWQTVQVAAERSGALEAQTGVLLV